MTGTQRIAAERQRQIEVEGWDAEHDAGHSSGDLTAAANNYAIYARRQLVGFEDLDVGMPSDPTTNYGYYGWPWEWDWWKPSDDPIRNLEKAGALIAAEIDRLVEQEEASNDSE